MSRKKSSKTPVTSNTGVTANFEEKGPSSIVVYEPVVYYRYRRWLDDCGRPGYGFVYEIWADVPHVLRRVVISAFVAAMDCLDYPIVGVSWENSDAGMLDFVNLDIRIGGDDARN